MRGPEDDEDDPETEWFDEDEEEYPPEEMDRDVREWS
jgi:hypothetical protein